jgi:hypothetical protein
VAPATVDLEDIQRLVGNEQPVAIKAKATDWEQCIKDWTATRDLIAARLPPWRIVERLAKHAGAIAEAKATLDQVEAIRSQRLLLETSDPVNTARQSLAGLLRDAVQKAHAAHEKAFADAVAALATNTVWTKLTAVDQDSIKKAVGLTPPAKPNVTTDEALAETLERKPLSSAQAEIDAITGRVNQAIERAARLLEPKVQTVTLERATLRDADEVDAWIERQKTTLLEKLANGPVLVN